MTEILLWAFAGSIAGLSFWGIIKFLKTLPVETLKFLSDAFSKASLSQGGLPY